MKKYEIRITMFQIAFHGLDQIHTMTASEIFEASDYTNRNSNLIAQHDSKESALIAWEDFKSYGQTWLEKDAHNSKLLRGVIAWLQEADYSDSNEIRYCDVIEFSAEPFYYGNFKRYEAKDGYFIDGIMDNQEQFDIDRLYFVITTANGKRYKAYFDADDQPADAIDDFGNLILDCIDYDFPSEIVPI